MSKRQVLGDLSFGQRIAEQEAAHLSNYFVETDLWTKLQRGDIDIIYGPKGSGKSALYSLLIARENEFFDRNILVVAAENPRGASAFSEIKQEPPTSEQEFVALWKLYFLCLLGAQLREYDGRAESAKKVIACLESEGLLQRDRNLKTLMIAVRDYAKRLIHPDSAQGVVGVDPLNGAITGELKITFNEPDADMAKRGLISVDSLLHLADDAIGGLGLSAWILLDRLDIAFEQSRELEHNALRALFRAYLDMGALQSISIKVFLRSDIWNRIIDGGFREASHITRTRTISWQRHHLINLVVRRLLNNPVFCAYYHVDKAKILASMDEQEALLSRILPEQVDAGERKLKTFAWMLSRTQDGTQITAPRELIHLLSTLQETQVARLELGHKIPPEETLFDRPVFKEALRSVSAERLSQTLYAEYHEDKPYIEKLRGEKTEQNIDTLAAIWAVDAPVARQQADTLVEVGFFEKRGPKETPTYWVPFLYRDALEMVQGGARSS